MPTVRVEVLEYGGTRAREGSGLPVIDKVLAENSVTPDATNKTLLSSDPAAARTVAVFAIGAQVFIAWGAAADATVSGNRKWLPAGGFAMISLEAGEIVTVTNASLS